jgi:hypothetical protein
MKLKKVFSETTEPISTKLCWNDICVVPFQNCVRQRRPVSKVATITPIGSYVKLSSNVAAILVCVPKCRTQFWKRTTQESFQQSLVEIGSVVSGDFLWTLKFCLFWPIIFSSETTEPISTKLCWNDSWVVLFQNCVRHFGTHLVAIVPVVSEEKIFMWISHKILC